MTRLIPVYGEILDMEVFYSDAVDDGRFFYKVLYLFILLPRPSATPSKIEGELWGVRTVVRTKKKCASVSSTRME